jgi:hypothetical protein
MTLIAQEIRAIIDKWDCIKLKMFCIPKVTVARIKRQATEYGKIVAGYLSQRGLKSRIYKEIQILITMRKKSNL